VFIRFLLLSPAHPACASAGLQQLFYGMLRAGWFTFQTSRALVEIDPRLVLNAFTDDGRPVARRDNGTIRAVDTQLWFD